VGVAPGSGSVSGSHPAPLPPSRSPPGPAPAVSLATRPRSRRRARHPAPLPPSRSPPGPAPAVALATRPRSRRRARHPAPLPPSRSPPGPAPAVSGSHLPPLHSPLPKFPNAHHDDIRKDPIAGTGPNLTAKARFEGWKGVQGSDSAQTRRFGSANRIGAGEFGGRRSAGPCHMYIW
jgi:hypothetical protein